MIVGISGPYGSGKGEIVRFLENRSFYSLSLSDVIREELKRRAKSETREEMISLGNALRREEGSDALVKRIQNKLSPDRNHVVDSIRHPDEVLALRRMRQKFLLLWVDAEPSTRLARINRRSRAGDPKDLEGLTSYEKREKADDGPTQQLGQVRELADRVIVNDGSIEELHEKVRDALEDALYFERPDWDEYFMNIASVVATRSNCIKRNVAALITVDRRIISTGYNGTPRGTTNCNEGGCPRCSRLAPGGVDLGECLCSHAEENAITQAAYHGVRVAGGSVYSTFCPCLMCTKMIINAGLREVVFRMDYPLGETSLRLLREAGVALRKLEATGGGSC